MKKALNKEPLYRKVNTKAAYCFHWYGSDAAKDRGTKHGIPKSMKKDVRRGLDYTPLYKFLLSKVGKEWDAVYSEACSRLITDEPIWHMVENNKPNHQTYFNLGYFINEKSFYSKLFVDENGILQKKDPSITADSFTPSCPCYTHTFNGIRFTKKYKYADEL